MHTARFCGPMRAPGGWVLPQCLVGPVGLVVADVLAEYQPQVPFAGDQHPVQAIVAGAGNPSLRSRSRAARTSVLMIRTLIAVNITSNAVTRDDHHRPVSKVRGQSGCGGGQP